MKFTEFEHNNNWKIKKFPCSCCLVLPICNDYTSCELLEQNVKKIFKTIQKEKRCPDCGEVIHDTARYNVKCYNCEHLFKLSYNYKMAWRDKQ